MVAIDLIDPNPDQPRQAMGDLSELIASVAEKGIIEPLVVRQRGPRYQIIAGERRYHAAVQSGLHELPVVVRDVDETEMLELALVENIQRKDLTPFEEAEALHEPGAALRLHPRGSGQAAGQVADLGHRVAVAARDAAGGPQGLPPGGHQQQVGAAADRPPGRSAEDAGAGREDRQPGRRHREQVRKETQKPKPGRPKAFTFNFRPQNKAFNLRLSFNKKSASKDEIIAALENILQELRKT